MEQWEYAVGHSGLSGEWDNDTDPTTFELASRDLIEQTILYGHEDWADDLRIVKRSIRHAHWQPVVDHAAELLAEALGEVARNVSRAHSSASPSKTVAHYLALVAKAVSPNTETEEYDK